VPAAKVAGMNHRRHRDCCDQCQGVACRGPSIHRLLAVEVRSPGTALIDLNRKKAAYEAFGVTSYWIVGPDRALPSLIVFELRDGRYQEVAHVAGDEGLRLARPFQAEVIPARLVAGLFTD
jgi:Uma2 family endonuclease